MRYGPNAYKLSIAALIVVLALGTGFISLAGGFTAAAPYLALVSTAVVPALIALLRSETNAKEAQVRHHENKQAISDNAEALKSLEDRLDALR